MLHTVIGSHSFSHSLFPYYLFLLTLKVFLGYCEVVIIDASKEPAAVEVTVGEAEAADTTSFTRRLLLMANGPTTI